MADVELKDKLTSGGGLTTTPPSPGPGVPYTLGIDSLQTDAMHGNRGGGSLHAIVTDSVAGFMSAAMKMALDAVVIAVAAMVNLVTSKRFRTTNDSTFAYASSSTPSFDVSTNSIHTQTDTLTGDVAVTLANGVDGDRGTIWFAQDATGGRKVTGVTASGRTVFCLSSFGLTFNAPTVLYANAVFGLGYEYATVNSTAYVLIWPIPTRTAGFT